MAPTELDAWLAVFHARLAPTGRLVVADVIAPDAGASDDIRALLGAALAHGFLLDALKGLVATFFSDYRRLRRDLGLTRYGTATMLAKLCAAGFVAEQRAVNLGFNQRRSCFLATPHPATATTTVPDAHGETATDDADRSQISLQSYR